MKYLFHMIHNARIELISFLLPSLSKLYDNHITINTKSIKYCSGNICDKRLAMPGFGSLPKWRVPLQNKGKSEIFLFVPRCSSSAKLSAAVRALVSGSEALTRTPRLYLPHSPCRRATDFPRLLP